MFLIVEKGLKVNGQRIKMLIINTNINVEVLLIFVEFAYMSKFLARTSVDS